MQLKLDILAHANAVQANCKQEIKCTNWNIVDEIAITKFIRWWA